MRRLPSPARLVLPALLLALALSFRGDTARADEESRDEPVSVVGPVLRRSVLVVRGTVEKVKNLGVGVELGTVRVEETLRGSAPADGRAVVLSNEEGYFRRHGGDGVYFLSRLEGRERYEVVAVVDLDGRDGAARLAALRRVFEVEDLPPGTRAEALRRVCFEGLAAPDAWTRRNAGRELAHLAAARPGTFTAGDADGVRRRAARETDTLLRPLLLEAAEALARAGRDGRLAPGTEGDRVSLAGAALLRRLRDSGDPEERRDLLERVGREEGAAAGEALAGCLEKDPDPTVRAAAAAALAARGGGDAGETLLTRLGAEGDETVRAAVVEGLGTMKAVAAVGPLAKIAAAGGGLADEALFALARVRDDRALAALRSLRADYAVTGGEGAAELRDLVDFLLSEDFLRQEEALRRLRHR